MLRIKSAVQLVKELVGYYEKRLLFSIEIKKN